MKTNLLAAAGLAAIAAACAPMPPTIERAAAPVREDGRTATADAAFDALAASFIDVDAQLNPIGATVRGDHRFDDRITDYSASGRARMLAEVDRHLDWLAGIDREALGRERQVDAALLENNLRYTRWGLVEERDWARNPQIYQGLAGGALYGLAARDFAPWDVRLKAATARMRALPRIFVAARANLDPSLVTPIMAQTVASQHAGIAGIVETMLAPHKDSLSAADRAAFDSAFADLKAAIEEHQRWLDEDLVPNAAGTHPLGAERYAKKLAFALQSPLSVAEIEAMAEETIEDSRAAMERLAVEALRAQGRDVPEGQQARIEAGLALSYAVRPERAELEQYARNLVDQSTAFTREKDFVTIPELNFEIITMPEFQQGYSVAYADPPGPQEQHLPAFYAVSPIPTDWSDEQATSFLSEYNHYMIHELNIHEAIPGHILQIAHSMRNDSELRAVLWSGAFVEGWAVYAEEVMREQGYLDFDPLYQMTVHKMRLRSAANALLDIGIHTDGMTEAEAMELMTRRTFQQEREAAGKWVRANLDSTQLPTYLVGYLEHMALREEAKRRWGEDFDLKRYHDTVLSYGSPPVRYARALMFDLPID